LVSIIIPTYNRATLLRDAVQSTIDQTYPNKEIVVVDDGSADNTRSIAEAFGDRITYIHQIHRGRSAARNTGVGKASGEYVVFLDSDDLLLPGKLERQTRLLQLRPDVDIVYGNGYTLTGDGRFHELEPYVVPMGMGDQPSATHRLLWRNLFAVHAAMARRAALPSTAPFDEALSAFEDWDLWLRMALAGSRILYHDHRVAVYRRHEGNTDARDAGVFAAPLTVIALKVIGQDLDHRLSAALRRRYRLGYLDIVIAHGSPRIIAAALRVILFSGRRPHISGFTSLARTLRTGGTDDRVHTMALKHALAARVPARLKQQLRAPMRRLRRWGRRPHWSPARRHEEEVVPDVLLRPLSEESAVEAPSS
jgi:glycosyltransferase involved in cell wall biosynthesis